MIWQREVYTIIDTYIRTTILSILFRWVATYISMSEQATCSILRAALTTARRLCAIRAIARMLII